MSHKIWNHKNLVFPNLDQFYMLKTRYSSVHCDSMLVYYIYIYIIFGSTIKVVYSKQKAKKMFNKNERTKTNRRSIVHTSIAVRCSNSEITKELLTIIPCLFFRQIAFLFLIGVMCNNRKVLIDNCIKSEQWLFFVCLFNLSSGF